MEWAGMLSIESKWYGRRNSFSTNKMLEQLILFIVLFSCFLFFSIFIKRKTVSPFRKQIVCEQTSHFINFACNKQICLIIAIEDYVNYEKTWIIIIQHFPYDHTFMSIKKRVSNYWLLWDELTRNMLIIHICLDCP